MGVASGADPFPASHPDGERTGVVRDYAEGAGGADFGGGRDLGPTEFGGAIRAGERANAGRLRAPGADECLFRGGAGYIVTTLQGCMVAFGKTQKKPRA